MKTTTIIAISILFQLTANAYAQKLKPAFDKYQAGQYTEAYKMFNKMRNSPKETVAAHYGIGLVYSSPQNPLHNNVTAYLNLSKAKSKYASASDEDKNNLSRQYSIDLYTIQALIDSTAAPEYRNAQKLNTMEGFYTFMRRFRESKTFCDMARQNITVLEHEHKAMLSAELEKATGDLRYTRSAIEGLNRFLYKNGSDRMFPRAKADSIARKIMDAAFQTGEPLAIQYIYSHMATGMIQRLTDRERRQLETANEVYNNVPFDEPYTHSQQPIYDTYIREAAPSDLAYVALLKMASPYISQQNYTQAADILSQYSHLFPNMTDRINKTISLLTGKAPEYRQNTKLPDAINKHYVGYPVLSADNKILYYAQYPLPFNHPISNKNQFDEDIYLCDYSNGKCENPRPLANINTPGNYERPSAVHPSGNELLYYYNNSIHTADLYGGGKPRQFAALSRLPQCTWVSDACYTHDGNAVLFSAIAEPGMGFFLPRTSAMGHGSTLGNPDIYICLKENGQWGRIINLGSVINTPYGEFCPVLASDMKTLYFSSNGHYGLGGTDLYVSRRLSDTSWTQWSEPINLGRNINTAFDDNNLCIGSDGKTAFYVKDDDIYTFQLPDEIKAEPVSIVEGVVKNKDDEPLAAHISWEDLSNGYQLGTLENNPVSGEFFITLPQGKNYGYVIESEGYFPMSGHINTSNADAITIAKDITMYSESDIIETGQPVVMENIFFDTGKYDLKKESYSEINRLLKFLNIDSRIRIEISGHTDNVGSHDSNVTLSLNRAQAVKNYLVSKGIAGSRIQVKGFGSDQPVSSNSTAAGRAQNRRVEFKVINVYND